MPGAGYSGCTSQDKIWSGFANGSGTAIPPAWLAAITYSPYPGYDLHDFTLSANNLATGSPNYLTAGTYTLDYLISIDPTSATYTSDWITSVQVSANVSLPGGAGSVTDTKALYTSNGGTYLGSVTSTNGLSSSIGVDQKSIWVQETITITGPANVHSITDEFTETFVPEPASMALMGAGLLALGGLLRRKKLAQ
jgi:hypothetical protein